MNFVQSKGGYFNTITSLEETNYFFRINNQSLFQTLEIFASFLSDPALKEKDIENEIKVVEEEWSFRASLYDKVESLIIYQISNPESQLKKYGKGNLKNLILEKQAKNISILKETNKFINDFYSASKIKVVIHTSTDIEELKDQVDSAFIEVPIRGKKQNFNITELPYRQSECQRIVYIQSLEKRNELNIFWPSDKSKQDYQKQNFQLFEYLIAPTQKNSILSVLRDLKWAFDVSASREIWVQNQQVLKYTIYLSDLGYRNWQKVLDLVFYYMEETVSQKTDSQLSQLFESLREMSQISFAFRKEDVLDQVREVAHNMHIFNISDIMTGENIIYKQNITIKRNFLKKLRRGNSFVSLISDQVEYMPYLDRKGRQYGVRYAVQNYPSKFEEAPLNWKQQLQTPPNLKNYLPFIKKGNFSETKTKYLIQDISYNKKFQILFQKIEDKNLANIYIRLESGLIYQSPLNNAMIKLYAIILQQKFRAELAQWI